MGNLKKALNRCGSGNFRTLSTTRSLHRFQEPSGEGDREKGDLGLPRNQGSKGLPASSTELRPSRPLNMAQARERGGQGVSTLVPQCSQRLDPGRLHHSVSLPDPPREAGP